MPANPLTHHELLTLVEPFAQSGWQLDLAATDRPERRLVFKPREHPSQAPLNAPFQETLVLENPESGRYRLIRTLTLDSGLDATLKIEGRDLASLLERLERIDPQVHFLVRPGVLIARSYRLIPYPGNDQGGSLGDLLSLALATADLGGVRFTLDAGTGAGGWPAELRLIPAPGRVFDPPEDLLAVLGWGWKPLRRIPQGWRTFLRLPKREPLRTQDCERKLVRTLDHLATALAQPPARFHARFRRARWGCVGRRLGGILVVVGALLSGPAILYFDPPKASVLRLLAFNTPNLLLFAYFLVREMPILRLPRRPGPLPATAWVPMAPMAPLSAAAPRDTPEWPMPQPPWRRALWFLGRAMRRKA